jgi:hypothetical protein
MPTSAESNDILAIILSKTKLGEGVTVQGVVRTNKDFSSGYAFKVLIEEATIKP